ncbi:glycogen/starch/alpha-glucan phosphorylase [Plebeiibacterium sediminum]|uniref:Alpha-1,4 glucan phosphorylase n=1 Tax=Plebeiibacterium sediminum TaxID=2992112 RepID=A0AAE3SGD0_9BACT|nr:glycogen/starch/alpha-glucan phosphorylase [Plebeiobacterium sediminum]MCW3788206.1 glycogen/starch/alpha-glucan phosphorylase [Plebeiobacterium sediminum]
MSENFLINNQGLESGKMKMCNIRTGLDKACLKEAIIDHLFYKQGCEPEGASINDVYLAVSYALRDRLLHHGLKTFDAVLEDEDIRLVSYLSAEFLMGPQLGANLIDLNIFDEMRQAVTELGFDFKLVLEQEEEPGLGNGGLGRLASCYMDSLASLEIPAIGYGIRYEFGIFDQEIKDGWQVEITDKWLRYGNPWEIARPESSVNVYFGGYTEQYSNEIGKVLRRWVPSYVVKGIPYDTSEMGYKVASCNFLRLWKSEAIESFDFSSFNHGDYYKAVMDKIESENISKILYPNDELYVGKQLRLKQQYFFSSCSLQDMMRMHLENQGKPQDFHKKWAIQLNDTHPAISVAELMRILLDECKLDWKTAWETTQQTFSYTNHTLLPEALEKWPLDLFKALLPRLLEIIYEINYRFLEEVKRRFPEDNNILSRLSLIEETGSSYVRMANLACVGSYAINGVASLHTELLKKNILNDWVSMYPDKFYNITNGITPRRFVVLSNPGLSKLITKNIGDTWPQYLNELKKLEPFAYDANFKEQFRQVKIENKRILSSVIKDRIGIVVNPSSMFDVQVKRIHEYKRQHLNVLHILTLYLRIKSNPDIEIQPRTFIFWGKAAPGYFMAKLLIKLINSVGNLVNNDFDVRDRIKVVFFPDFNVKNAQLIYPAADLSEQISTSGKEASGTGNMKFALNGALTIGTLDGANIEIREEVGYENFFLFGLTASQVIEVKQNNYDPRFIYENNMELNAVIKFINSGILSNGDRNLFKPITDNLLYGDPYLLLADYPLYISCQDIVAETWKDKDKWNTMAVLNVARMGKFSSDRSINDYCENIWKVKPFKLKIE